MNLSVSRNMRAIVKYFLTAVLMLTNSVLGLSSISLGLFVGIIVVNLFLPSYNIMAV